MAPKSLPPAAKQALIVSWIQKSGTAHTLKDLEKALPGVASINGMQVKDYIQAITDENLIRVEKIGSGNWYWSFLSDEKVSKEGALEKALAERERVVKLVGELQEQVREAGVERGEDGHGDDMLMEGGVGGDRETMMLRHAELQKEVEMLRGELASYSENDPVEVNKRKEFVEALRREAEVCTEQILDMEGWFKKQIPDKQMFRGMKVQWYGDQYDEEEAGLREI